jgi:hypothetical protein
MGGIPKPEDLMTDRMLDAAANTFKGLRVRP